MQSVCQEISDKIGNLFTCSQIGDYTRIRTPYVYPDGDYIDIFIREKAGLIVITDLGETMRWLKSQSLAEKRSQKQDRLIVDICITHRVAFERGMLSIKLHQDNRDLVEAVTDLSQAASRVADLWFILKQSAFRSIVDEVEELIRKNEIPYERNEKVIGQSGNTWKPNFYTRHPKHDSLIYVLATGKRAVASSITNRVVTAWYDLRYIKQSNQGTKFISLFDDSSGIWTPEDYRLLGELSEISYWSNKKNFLEKLVN